MKYIMFETENGQKLPVLFPETLTHSLVMMAVSAAIEICINSKAKPVNAGFVGIGHDVETYGESESLKLKSNPADSIRIAIGASVEFMPDDALASLLNQLKETLK